MDRNSHPPSIYRRFAISGTDTGVGKTLVTAALVGGLRTRGRKVWVHKPVACGDWDGTTAEDGRRLAPLAGDGQPPGSICRRQFAEPASPHLAARAAGVDLPLDVLRADLAAVQGDHDLVVEGAGGLLVPLSTDRRTLVDLLAPDYGLVIVTRPDLGTLNHTALTVAAARNAGWEPLGLVVNAARPVADTLAVRTAAAELTAITGLPVLADLAHGADPAAVGPALADAVLAR